MNSLSGTILILAVLALWLWADQEYVQTVECECEPVSAPVYDWDESMWAGKN